MIQKGHMMLQEEIYTIRPACMDDLEAVVTLMNICSMKIIGVSDDTQEQIASDWQMPGFDQAKSQRVVFSPQGQLVGFGEVRNQTRPSYPFLDIYVHPDYESTPVSDMLMEWGEKRAGEVSDSIPPDVRIAMQAAGYQHDTWYLPMLESAGMIPIRHHWRMEINLDTPSPKPEWPEGITVRTMIPGQDDRAVLEAQCAAFRDHWGHVEIPFEQHFERWQHEWQNEGDFDPSLWFLALDGDRIVGISLCKGSHNGEEHVGWISNLGVLREYRRRGVAMALLLHSFDVLRSRGKHAVGLGVDAGSLTGATKLYQKAGMSVVTQIVIYEKELRPGRDLARRE